MADLPSWRTIDHACIVSQPGNASEYLTGDWRSRRPVLDREKCVRCGRCWMFCPEPAIIVDEGGEYSFDYRYCKGCGICARECPYDAIDLVEECEDGQE